MNHKVDKRKLGLPSDQRQHLLTNLTRQFIRHGYVHTTLHRAKEVQRIAEKLITLAKKGNEAEGATKVHYMRQTRKVLVGHSHSSFIPPRLVAGKTPAERTAILQKHSLINGEDLVNHLFTNVAPRYTKRNGGYTRVIKTGIRRGDAGVTAILELVD